MIRINENFLKLQESYLFSTITRKVEAFQKKNPDVELIRMGIGDATRALPAACVEALHRAADEMANDATFRGYGPEQGYLFLREKIALFDFQKRGVHVEPDEIFISDGAKCDTANFQELFSTDIRIAIPDPVYPVYLDTNVMAGRTGRFENGKYQGVVYLEAVPENNYLPPIPDTRVDLVYLCFPNNPTGATATKDYLADWVEYAIENKALILYDAAYEAFIRDPEKIPKSIYEIPGARKVAVEFRSFSKTAGFTGTRCAYTVVPEECVAYDSSSTPHSLRKLWLRRHTTKFNGVSYPVQRAAEAVYTPEGQQQVKELVDGYMENASMIIKEMEGLGFKCTGGRHSPYVWVLIERDSWEFFDTLLEKAGVVCTPGDGFGSCGAGHVRFSAFNSHENVKKAMKRIRKALG